jgi:S-DNA-T family DNA segregation ATPase FtsK/SpoIIIE
MASETERDRLAGQANQMMRRLLHELETLDAHLVRDAQQIRSLRESTKREIAELERSAKEEASRFDRANVGRAVRRQLEIGFGSGPRRSAPGAPPESLQAADDEWNRVGGGDPEQPGVLAIQEKARTLTAELGRWEQRMFKRAKGKPSVPVQLWKATDRMQDIWEALPMLKERFIANSLREAERHSGAMQQTLTEHELAREAAYAQAREVVAETKAAAGRAAAPWIHDGWREGPNEQLAKVLRIGEFASGLPAGSGLPTIPALLEFPFRTGVDIVADVEHRQQGIGLTRSLVMRILAAVPPGDVRFTFIDPVSVGQSVAEFRHLAEFDQQVVGVRTWTSERDITARLEELSDHLEVVISSYLRGQFDSISAYNEYAGEVAEPYRVLVVFDYPESFTDHSARHLLSLIENGPRCGVTTVLVRDPGREAVREMPTERLVHSLQQVDLTRRPAHLRLSEPIGDVPFDFACDDPPPIGFNADGRATTPCARLLLDIGARLRRAHTDPVTLDRVFPIVNRMISAGRTEHTPELAGDSTEILPDDPMTWWHGSTKAGAFAPIGRAGAQDVAALYFSSTEIAGGGIIVGLPRSGKSTAMHAAILSLAITYPPAELELFLIDSKHGVEFKVYEELPHAKLVSVHSDREFSVAVLQSLDREIQRRAELMKQHTAGRANITEYRAVSGKRLARIVVFMDEFHELFEEDDALGHAAFMAFSNIVRQGPFAGIHIVVGSQTLSSMPALDRSTLALLPMRIAFMCNDTDADIVMGDTNREVRALSQQGQGIFNPARGDPSHNKPFRGLYVTPDERQVALTRLRRLAAERGLTEHPRVFDGDALVQRWPEWTPGSDVKLTIAMGEPLSLDPWAGVTVRRGRGGNVLILGRGADGDEGDASIDGALHSCVADTAAHGADTVVVDFLGDDATESDGLSLIELCTALSARYRRTSSLPELLADLSAELESRRAAAAYDRPATVLVLVGLQRAADVHPFDPYLEPVDDASTQLSTLLQNGPEFGLHCVVSVDGLAQFDRRLGRDCTVEFDVRVLGNESPAGDVHALSEDFSMAQIGRHQLLLIDRGRGRKQRVRAYPRHTRTSLTAPTGGR